MRWIIEKMECLGYVSGVRFRLIVCAILTPFVAFTGLPNDLKVYWQQYPWGLGVALCKIRALVSEM